MTAPVSLAEMRGPLLRSVSRSFYLSIRLLPAKVRDPVALAYLLARATDTIADTTEVEANVRVRELANLAAMIQEDRAAGSIGGFASLQKNPAERALIESVPHCLQWLAAIGKGDRANIRGVLASINEGQALDVQRFGDPAQITALQTAADLDRYTYLVAGSVGEFWTDVCFRQLRDFTATARTEMVSSGVAYGKGLQLVNILRDLGADLRAGRCYLPAEELHSLGLTPQDLKREPSRALPLVQAWRVRAEQGIAAGIAYSCAVRPWRARLATALPALIGARTLALLREAGPSIFTTKVKVSRAEIRQIVLHATLTLASPSSLQKAFRTLSLQPG